MHKHPKRDYLADEFPDISDTVSTCECTGLMPSPPLNDAQWAAYKSLFSMEVCQGENETEEKKKGKREAP